MQLPENQKSPFYTVTNSIGASHTGQQSVYEEQEQSGRVFETGT